MKQRIAIIGAGPGGYTAALRAAASGADVSLIEKGVTGGVCLNWGCIPSKIMKHTADLLATLHKAANFGITGVDGADVDLALLRARQDKVISTLSRAIDSQLARAGVTRLHGTARFDASGSLLVTGPEGVLYVSWDKLIIACGTTPLELPGLAFDGKHILSSDHLLRLPKLPKSIIIVGGGVIGSEFSFILNAMGVEVTVAEALDRLLPLPSIDHECSKILARQMKKNGISLLLNRMVQQAAVGAGTVKVTLRPADSTAGNSEEHSLTAETLAVCVGRQSVAADLGLEHIGVPLTDQGWLQIDSELRTANHDVFAIGDVLGPAKPMLAHVAIREGEVAADNALGQKRVMNYDAIPAVVFSRPEVGCIGLTEQQALDQGLAVSSRIMQFRTSGKAHVLDEIDGMVKIVANRKSGTVLGVHMIGPHASDLIAEGGLSVASGGTVAQLAETIHAHPTLAETVMEAARLPD